MGDSTRGSTPGSDRRPHWYSHQTYSVRPFGQSGLPKSGWKASTAYGMVSTTTGRWPIHRTALHRSDNRTVSQGARLPSARPVPIRLSEIGGFDGFDNESLRRGHGRMRPQVQGVFRSEALAEAFIVASAGAIRELRIEEYELDPANDWGDVYEVHMDRNGGIFVASPKWTHLPHGWWNFDVRRPEYWVLRNWVPASDRYLAIAATKVLRDRHDSRGPMAGP